MARMSFLLLWCRFVTGKQQARGQPRDAGLKASGTLEQELRLLGFRHRAAMRAAPVVEVVGELAGAGLAPSGVVGLDLAQVRLAPAREGGVGIGRVGGGVDRCRVAVAGA